jgi:hypothetical protein
MPRSKGVYRDSNVWYFKARTSKDLLTGKWTQATRRGFATATEASIARRALLAQGACLGNDVPNSRRSDVRGGWRYLSHGTGAVGSMSTSRECWTA